MSNYEVRSTKEGRGFTLSEALNEAKERSLNGTFGLVWVIGKLEDTHNRYTIEGYKTRNATTTTTTAGI